MASSFFIVMVRNQKGPPWGGPFKSNINYFSVPLFLGDGKGARSFYFTGLLRTV